MKSRTISPIILAGGGGAGLWPVSRDALPRQFARLAAGLSLFQQTLALVADSFVYDQPVVVAARAHADLVRAQLAAIGCEDALVLHEPEARGDGAATALAASLQLGRPESALLLLSCDQAFDDPIAFGRGVQAGARLARRNDCIVAFGVRPTRPNAGCAFLRAGAPMLGEEGMLFDSLVENPDAEKAARLARTPGVFWRSGAYVFDRATVLAQFRAHAPRLLAQVDAAVDGGAWDGNDFHPLVAAYAAVEPITFDEAILERTGRAAVVPLETGWSDMKSWSAVWERAERDANENALNGPAWSVATHNSLAISDGPTIGMAGLEDIVVVANRDAVLVASRTNPREVDRLVEAMRAQGVETAFRHAGEDRTWGRFDTLDRGGSHHVVRLVLEPGGQLPLQYHHHRSEHWIVVRGLATITLDDRVMAMGPCQQVFVPQGAVHRLENLTDAPVEVIEVRYGHYLGEDDAVVVDEACLRAGGPSRRPAFHAA